MAPWLQAAVAHPCITSLMAGFAVATIVQAALGILFILAAGTYRAGAR